MFEWEKLVLPISVGIFIIYIVVMFILLRPSVSQGEDLGNLLSIVQNNFINQTSTIIKQLPVKIISCTKPDGITAAQTVLLEEITGKWKSTKINPQTSTITIGNDVSITDCPQAWSDPEEFTVFYAPTQEHTLLPEFSTDCTTCLEIGLTRELTGISRRKLNDVFNIKYDILKTNWNFPQAKEFILKADTESRNYELKPTFEKPDNTNIFVKEIDVNILEEEGIKTRAKIHFEVW